MTRNAKIAISVLIAAAAVISTFGYFHFQHASPGQGSAKLPSIELGPKLSIGVYNFSTNPSVENNTTIMVQVFGLFPQVVQGSKVLSVNLSSVNESNNTDYVQLLNTTFSTDGVTVFLSPMFLNVAYAWESVMSLGDRPSLTLEASKSVYVNGSIDVYTYYNNILYNPMSVFVQSLKTNGSNSQVASGWFSNTSLNVSDYSYVNYTAMAFNEYLTFPDHPSWVAKGFEPHATGSRASVKGEPVRAGTDSGSYYYNTTIYSTYTNITGTNSSAGYLPLIAVHLSNNTRYGLSEVSFFAAVIQLEDTTIGIESNQVSWTDSGEVTSSLSVTPSYEHVTNSNFESTGNSFLAMPLNESERLGNNLSSSEDMTTAYVAIENAIYTFVHFTVYSAEYTNEYLVVRHLKPIIIDGRVYFVKYSSQSLVKSTLVNQVSVSNGSIGEISNIENFSHLAVTSGRVPLLANKLIQALAERNPSQNLSLAAEGPGDSLSGGSIYSTDSSYTNANQVIKDANLAMSVFTVGLTEGLAITDALAAANGADFDGEEAAVVAETIGLIGAETALESSILSYFDTIGFVAKSTSAGIIFGITNYAIPTSSYGSNYRFVYYQSETPVTMSFDGNTYQFLAPMDYLNFTEAVPVSAANNNLYLSTPENSSLSVTPGMNQTSGVWTIDPNDHSEEIAYYHIPGNAQYMAGNIFNQYQDFAFQPGSGVGVYQDQYYDMVGNVTVNLIDSQGDVVATWYHDFYSKSSHISYNASTTNLTNDWVYINPTFNLTPIAEYGIFIPEPIVGIEFINDLGSSGTFTSIGNGGLISFAEAQPYDNSINNPLPMHRDESGLAWHGYSSPNLTATWSIPANYTSYMIIWASPYELAVTYDGYTEYGYSGLFFGYSADSLSAMSTCYFQGTETITISEVFELS